MISFRQADLINRLRPQHGRFRGVLTLLYVRLGIYDQWIVPEFTFVDTPELVRHALMESLVESGADSIYVQTRNDNCLGWEISEGDQAASIDDHISDLQERMKEHDFEIGTYDRGHAEINMEYFIDI